MTICACILLFQLSDQIIHQRLEVVLFECFKISFILNGEGNFAGLAHFNDYRVCRFGLRLHIGSG